jgi:hypothetical protein
VKYARALAQAHKMCEDCGKKGRSHGLPGETPRARNVNIVRVPPSA